ncbi:NADPH-dependent glutamate synthase, NADPH oxidoreductase subunit [Syntrophotalea carbinolica DSM 2380]|uniref:NADPH-dependent glutamate synthase, NADPH oxidoreductase subunit n=1 Tax=Syntrophotalea carbinolica (strain DSM 2380 / NBRC 103641 / GraBd1) TaxID=338963 RepID=Q3A4H8_SYNC1|nr:glutamate synthase subunit beta [Syntrophotalea carbinolica]ABA88729.1 NADPH-dependent glutamate synthase, NADPH oxidoreductase subunit [Syntrophotalea carbinolica DSM 2380]
MQNFIENQRRDPEKKNVKLRLRSFDEIYHYYDLAQVAPQAERCIQCGDPFCATIGCPLGNHIPQWLAAIAAKDLEQAFLLSNESSPFPEILGRICPHNVLCECACTLNDGYGAIAIGPIEASITDLGFASGLELPFPGVIHPKKVAVIGSGPAGISSAHFLLRAGIGVDMYERADEPGGLLALGIPNFKLDKGIVRHRFEILDKAGLQLHLNCEVGRDIDFDQLLESHDAVFLGVGATGGRLPHLAHERHGNVFRAMEFLTAIQHDLEGEPLHPRFNVRDKQVVVIGGGDTAMDCLRTSVREGAESVTCLYRRDPSNMPGSHKEYHNAQEEGVTFLFHRAPTKIIVDEGDGHLTGVEVLKTQLAGLGADGRHRVANVPDSEHCIPAEVLILALGFDVEEFAFLQQVGVETDGRRRLVTETRSGRTSHPKIYAGGDCARGSHLAVTAAADGRRAALAIITQLLDDA